MAGLVDKSKSIAKSYNTNGLLRLLLLRNETAAAVTAPENAGRPVDEIVDEVCDTYTDPFKMVNMTIKQQSVRLFDKNAGKSALIALGMIGNGN